MRVTSLGSGSSGNAYLIEAGPQYRTRLLVDAGFPTRILAERLGSVGTRLGRLQGVLVTHEHSDHIMGLPLLMKRHRVPIFADPRTLAELRTIFSSGQLRDQAGTLVNLETELSNERDGTISQEITIVQTELSMKRDGTVSQEITVAQTELSMERDGRVSQEIAVAQTELSMERDGRVSQEIAIAQTALPTNGETLWQALPAGTQRIIGDIQVHSFPVSHDAIAPCGYLLSAGGCRVCIVTDTGEVTPIMLAAITQADLLILESNHDRARLLSGPYPYPLKQRILSPTGHLSNDQAAEAVLCTWRPDSVRWLWLAHLSRTNNTRKLALTSMQNNLCQAGVSLAQIHISVLSPDMGTSWDSTLLWQDEGLWKM
jgi:phosphoribosyl 1,2-cyclic phosphodiesterase